MFATTSKKIAKRNRSKSSFVRIFGLTKVKQFAAVPKNKFVFTNRSLSFVKKGRRAAYRNSSLFMKALIRKYARESSLFYSYRAKKRSALFPQAIRLNLNHKNLWFATHKFLKLSRSHIKRKFTLRNYHKGKARKYLLKKRRRFKSKKRARKLKYLSTGLNVFATSTNAVAKFRGSSVSHFAAPTMFLNTFVRTYATRSRPPVKSKAVSKKPWSKTFKSGRSVRRARRLFSKRYAKKDKNFEVVRGLFLRYRASRRLLWLFKKALWSKNRKRRGKRKQKNYNLTRRQHLRALSPRSLKRRRRILYYNNRMKAYVYKLKVKMRKMPAHAFRKYNMNRIASFKSLHLINEVRGKAFKVCSTFRTDSFLSVREAQKRLRALRGNTVTSRLYSRKGYRAKRKLKGSILSDRSLLKRAVIKKYVHRKRARALRNKKIKIFRKRVVKIRYSKKKAKSFRNKKRLAKGRGVERKNPRLRAFTNNTLVQRPKTVRECTSSLKTISASFLNLPSIIKSKKALKRLSSNLGLRTRKLHGNRFYTRVYLRRRARAAAVLYRRRKAHRRFNLSWPQKYSSLNAARRRLTWRARKIRRRLEKKLMSRLHYPHVFSRAAEPLATVDFRNVTLRLFKRLRAQHKRSFLRRLPHFTLAYRLLFRRWHSYRDKNGNPLPRTWPTRAEIRRLAAINRLRRRKGLRLKKRPDPVFNELTAEMGNPASIGYRRRRRVLLSKFNTRAPSDNRHVSAVVLSSQSVSALGYSKFTSTKKVFNLNGALTLKQQVKRFGSKRAPTWRLHQNAKQAFQRPSWRAIPTLSKPGAHVWSLNHIEAIVSSLPESSAIWSRITLASSLEVAQTVRTAFIENSSAWLSERYSERLLFDKLSSSNFSGSEVANLLLLNRLALFSAHPHWWVDEAKRRLNVLSSVIPTVNIKSLTITDAAAAFLNTSKVHYAGASSLQSSLDSVNERSLLKQTLSLLPRPKRLAVTTELLRNSSNVGAESELTSYNFWLSDIGTSMKKIKQVYSGKSLSSLDKDAVISLGTDQPRFPGAGRRRASYDRAMRLFYRKTSLSRFRRTQTMRFVRLRPRLHTNAYARLPAFATKKQQKSVRFRNYTSSSYLPRSWRRLQNRRRRIKDTGVLSTQSSLAFSATTKRRLAASPTKSIFSENANKSRSVALSANVELLLLAGIKARMKSRQLQDLSVHAGRRVLPPEQILPPWMQARKLRNKRKARYMPATEYPKLNTQDESANVHWTVSNFAVTVVKNRTKNLSISNPIGEVIRSAVVYRRRKGSAVGYTIARSERKVRRFKRRRRYRGKLLKRSKFKKRRKFVRNRRRYKKRMTRSWRFLKRVAGRRWLQRVQTAKTSFGYRLTDLSQLNQPFTPLHFAKKTKAVVISDQEKQRQSEGLEALKHVHYRKAAQMADVLTSFFPQLISFLIEKKVNLKAVSRKELKGMIRSIYWGLRFYLQTDVEGRRNTARNAHRAQFSALRNQITRDAAGRYFDSAAFKNARMRYQPHKLLKMRSLRRGALDWLRMFFPRFHALYLEDPEEYRAFFLSATQVARAHPSRNNPGQWSTNKVFGSMENKFKRLLKQGNKNHSSRFENVLMTTKRTPVITGYGAAADMRHGSFTNSIVTPKSSFFRRSYSNHAFLHSNQTTTKTMQRVVKFNRFAYKHGGSLPDYKALSLKYRLSPRLYNKELLYKADNSAEVSSSSVDPRFLRQKSPRSGLFLQRLKSPTYSFSYDRSLAKTVSGTLKSSLIFRADRRSSLNFDFNKVGRHADSLSDSRSSLKVRQSAGSLNRRLSLKLQRLYKFRRLYTDKSRIARRHDKKKVLWCKKVLNKNLVAISQKTSVTSNRSVLHFRRASQRLSFVKFIRAVSIPHKAIVLKPSVRNVLRSYNFSSKLLAKTYKKRYLHGSSWFIKKSSRVKLGKLAKTRKLLHLGHRPLSFAPKLRLQKNFFLKRSFLSNTKLSQAISRVNRRYRPRTIFSSQTRNLYKNRRLISAFLVNKEFRELNNIGAIRRKEVWDMLTLRWMKKRRILKNWLKNVKRGLKRDKWAFMPELIFKGMRSRLRKLEWRERDDHFSRKGWRSAFSFHPKERRRAPWLEKLMYRRSLYSTIRGSYRRYQFPREQKRLKWLQNYRRAVISPRRSKKYLKGRRWPKLRIYNQRLFRSFFSLKNKHTTQRHFKKLSRRKPSTNGFSKSLLGIGDRLDVNLVLLNIAPTIFWAKVLATFGLFRINNKVVCDPAYRFKANDRIFWNWALIENLRTYFQRPLKHYEVAPIRNTSAAFPKNFDYFPKIRTAIYKGLPTASDLAKNSRLSPFLFKLFKADSGSGRQ